jgi:nucleotide-binding universal stress UspA family protein
MTEIVVGIDGSDGSRKALAWAVAEAQLRNGHLTAVLAWQVPLRAAFVPDWPGPGELDAAIEAQRVAVARVLDDACSAATDTLGDRLTRLVVEGPPAPVLLRAAQNADLLVVGTRGRGGFAGLLLGSVSQQCAQHAPCPLVIVPPEPESP